MAAKILVVEDDRDIRRNLRMLLESEDYEVDTAENGQVALNLLNAAASLPFLIILDLSMPVMDGQEFRMHQRSSLRLSPIPVLLLTADANIEEKKRLTGVNMALKKPVDIEVILNAVGKFR